MHDPFIDKELFEQVQKLRIDARLKPNKINIKARTYSLSGIATCQGCGGNIRMQTTPNGKARVYCASRSQGHGCDFGGTFLERYENQIEWYLKEFFIPEDYHEKIIEAHSQLTSAYGDDINSRRLRLSGSLQKLKKQYQWSHVTEHEYISEYKNIERQLAQLNSLQDKQEEIQRIAHFLANVADAWKEATQEQRNRLAKLLFEEIRLDNGGTIVAVKPKVEFEPFFRLSYDCHTKDIASDPSGDWGLDFITLENSSQLSLKNGSNSGCGLTATTSLSLTQTSWNKHRTNLFRCSLVALSQALVILARNSANFFRGSVEILNGISLVS
jgi:hypothetical protein